MQEKSKTVVVTHDGVFHADELFALAILKIVGESFIVERTRDPQKIAAAKFCIDVGGVFDGQTLFDHHQSGFDEKRPNGIPYASAGLVWRVFGPQLCGRQGADIVDQQLIQQIDAADCGFELSKELTVKGVLPFTISHVIAGFNPVWDDPESKRWLQFLAAWDCAYYTLDNAIRSARGFLRAKDTVALAVACAQAAGKKYVLLDKFCPWQNHLFGTDYASEVLYVVFQDPTGSWRIQCVPSAAGRFDKKKPLPQEWAGKNGAELSVMCGVTDAIFCHKACFIMGVSTRDSAILIAESLCE